MLKEFAYSQVVNIDEMSARCTDMREVLALLDEGGIADDQAYSFEDLDSYVRSLVNGRRKSLGRTIPGSWSVAPTDAGLDAAARVEFVVLPTYVAVATLSRVVCEFPLLALAVPGYMDVLRKGMVFASLRKLAVPGFEADPDTIEALHILCMGRVPWLLHRHPSFCPELKSVLDEAANALARRLGRRTALGAWGEDYSEGFRAAVENLRLKNGRDVH